MGLVTIRPATVDDADAIAHVHVLAWRETYRGLMPASVLDDLSVERRAESWRHVLNGRPAGNRSAVFVATVDQDVVGFGACGQQRDVEHDAAGFDGEFQAIYLLAAAKRQGVGRRLMTAMAASMSASGYSGGSLWVLTDNRPARRFYEALGGTIVGRREERRSEDLVLHEVAYVWPDLALLASFKRPSTKA